MDIAHAGTRWLSRRLLGLLPALAAGALVLALLAVRRDLGPGLRPFALTTASLLHLLLAYLVVQSVRSARRFAAGRFREARSLRHTALPVGAAPMALALLAGLAALPGDPPAPARRTPFPLPPVRRASEHPTPVVARSEETAVVPVRLDLLPPLPLGLWEDVPGPEIDLFFAFTPLPAGPESSQAADNRDFALLVDRRDGYTWGQLLRTERSYLPEERAEDQAPPASFRLDALRLAAGDGRAEGALALEIDLPLQPGASLRFASLAAAFEDDGPKGQGLATDVALSRSVLDYVVRLAGHTRQARFDLSASVGFSLDVLHGDDGLPVDGRGRIAPYASIEAGLWQSGPAGLLLRVGQSIPVNLTGGSSAVTDVSAVFRFDISDRISAHAGYRYVVLRFRDYDRALGHEDGSDRYDTALSGPLLGIDIRF